VASSNVFVACVKPLQIAGSKYATNPSLTIDAAAGQVGDGVGVIVGVTVGVGVIDVVGVTVGVTDGVGVIDGVIVGVTVGVGVGEAKHILSSTLYISNWKVQFSSHEISFFTSQPLLSINLTLIIGAVSYNEDRVKVLPKVVPVNTPRYSHNVSNTSHTYT
jgi:hypothetical protein